MRKSLEQLGSATENYGDAMLRRFLVARSINPMKAAKMLVSWKKWREEFVPLGFIPDFEGPNELKAKKNYLQGPTPIQDLPFYMYYGLQLYFPTSEFVDTAIIFGMMAVVHFGEKPGSFITLIVMLIPSEDFEMVE
ncbi:hypothetical protein IFM89_016185 [Coptis chinensis]|uniref:CRAL-TRIO domain-containing protein n=1 Tax=Coptis chinensis TaxID=261450 RepID=A0A835GYF1_9MAGN|nr:hypothetical protein IFM89_016185 [Coptis chinensis]